MNPPQFLNVMPLPQTTAFQSNPQRMMPPGPPVLLPTQQLLPAYSSPRPSHHLVQPSSRMRQSSSFEGRVFVGLGYRLGLADAVRGPQGSFLSHIQTCTNVTISLNGKGSGTLEKLGSITEESPEPLHFNITAPSKDAFEHAKSLALSLVTTIREQEESNRTKQPVPSAPAVPKDALRSDSGVRRKRGFQEASEYAYEKKPASNATSFPDKSNTKQRERSAEVSATSALKDKVQSDSGVRRKRGFQEASEYADEKKPGSIASIPGKAITFATATAPVAAKVHTGGSGAREATTRNVSFGMPPPPARKVENAHASSSLAMLPPANKKGPDECHSEKAGDISGGMERAGSEGKEATRNTGKPPPAKASVGLVDYDDDSE